MEAEAASITQQSAVAVSNEETAESASEEQTSERSGDTEAVSVNGKCEQEWNGGSGTESETTKICDIAGVCTIKFNSKELHTKYFESVKNYLEHLLRDSAEDLTKLFCVDTTRTESSVPLKQFYQSVNNNSLLEEAQGSPSKRGVGGRNCFNCLGDHHINECPNPIDRKAVAENRRKLQSKQVGLNGRFFEDEDRSGRFTPGKWSKRLLEAMGVRTNEIPPFVYRMRVLGYPPGWLCEAEETTSGIKLFDGSGNEVQHELSGEEDGLVEDEDPIVRYDPEKLIGIPGFNIEARPGTADDCWRLGMPPIQPHQSRALAVASMNLVKEKEPRPRKLRLPPPKNSEEAPTKTEESPKLKRPADDQNGVEDQDTSPPSAKMRKLEDVDDSDRTTPVMPPSSPLEPLVGTPIPGSISNIESLPSAEKWSEGVAEHIPYENLPGATGTFEKMRGLLLKIKDLKKTD